ncbi:MAG: hypothetical protein U5P41_07205 [Gammaproteobacteria bacterium]|nr:hypothetical protein [Gammaproteobacteria bacterium]
MTIRTQGDFEITCAQTEFGERRVLYSHRRVKLTITDHCVTVRDTRGRFVGAYRFWTDIRRLKQ